MKVLGTAFALCFAVMAGCASAPPPLRTALSSDQTLNAPPSDKAQIVFLQPFKPLGGYADTPLYDITGDKAELLNVLTSQGKLAVLVAPGQHTFMINGMGIAAMQANVEAGKRYYVVSRFRAYQSYQLRPVRKNGPSEFNASSPDFAKWQTGTKFEGMSESGQTTYSNPTLIAKWKVDALDKWSRLSADEKKELTLNADDAVMD
jgi:hypothetical protein